MGEPTDAELPPDRTCERWLVSGRVQGVGFRYHVLLAAHRLGVTGEVRNLPDGRVEVRAQGPHEGLAGLMAHVRSGPPGARVESVDSTKLDGAPRYDTFTIR